MRQDTRLTCNTEPNAQRGVAEDGFGSILWHLGEQNLPFIAIDVSQAFMNSPLRDKERTVLRMPLSISTTSGEPIFLEAHKALNGLRVRVLLGACF